MNTPEIILGKRKINQYSLPYVIAEIGVNHEGSIEKAKDLIKLAKDGGADAAKFQTYKAETIASKNSPSYWDLTNEPTRSQFKLFKKYDVFNEEDFIDLANYCRTIDIEFLSTPFDSNAIDFLDPLMQFFKIASADITNLPFLRKIATKGKPVILSTGASTIDEIKIAVDNLHKHGASNIALLHCILNYPTQNENASLGMINGLKYSFPEYLIGYSDHTLPDQHMTTLKSAYLLGARIIEKHFTYNKKLTGNDHYHAMDVEDLKVFMKELKIINTLIGQKYHKEPIPQEELSILNARRSIVLSEHIKAGEEIREENITYKRPGTGISPLHWDQVLGRRVNRDLNEDHVLLWDDLI